MDRTGYIMWAGAVLLLVSGCMTGPLQDNPLHVQSPPPPPDNPVYVPLGPASYGALFEQVIDVLDDYYEISYMNRYDGRIETFPRTAPGIEQPWRAGSPDLYQRLLATFQSIRHRAIVQIQPAENDGYFVTIKVLKELEDLPQPAHRTAGASTYRSFPTLERQYEVVESGFVEAGWIPIGRDCKLEQVLLSRLSRLEQVGCR